jgi:hypothetical protein
VLGVLARTQDRPFASIEQALLLRELVRVKAAFERARAWCACANRWPTTVSTCPTAA